MKDLNRLKEHIYSKLDMTNVLIDYGVKFIYNPKKLNETQLRCPFHGKDNKPSARFYKETQTLYCWVCMKKWDLVGFIMERESLNFIEAIRFLIDRYKIDTSGIPDDPRIVFRSKTNTGNNNQVDLIRIRDGIRKLKGKLDFNKYNRLYYAYQIVLLCKDTTAIKKLELKLQGLK